MIRDHRMHLHVEKMSQMSQIELDAIGGSRWLDVVKIGDMLQSLLFNCIHFDHNPKQKWWTASTDRVLAFLILVDGKRNAVVVVVRNFCIDFIFARSIRHMLSHQIKQFTYWFLLLVDCYSAAFLQKPFRHIKQCTTVSGIIQSYSTVSVIQSYPTVSVA